MSPWRVRLTSDYPRLDRRSGRWLHDHAARRSRSIIAAATRVAKPPVRSPISEASPSAWIAQHFHCPCASRVLPGSSSDGQIERASPRETSHPRIGLIHVDREHDETVCPRARLSDAGSKASPHGTARTTSPRNSPARPCRDTARGRGRRRAMSFSSSAGAAPPPPRFELAERRRRGAWRKRDGADRKRSCDGNALP